jgi:CBS domain-containing protein
MSRTMKGHARNLMTERVISFEPTTPLSEMLRRFTAEGLSGAPVVDHNHRVLGFVSETDLLGALLRTHPSEGTVADVMHTPAVVVDEFMPTEDVMNVLRKSHIHYLPVVREGRLVGIITPTDILRYFVEREMPVPPTTA